MRWLILAAAVLAAAFSAVAVAAPTGNFNNGQPHSCTYGGTSADADLQNESVTCTGTISGLGNNARAAVRTSCPGSSRVPGHAASSHRMHGNPGETRAVLGR